VRNVVMTAPGKLGDAIHQIPVAYWYAKENGIKLHMWLDKHTCRPLVPLLEAQPWVESVELKEGIESWHMGGQPFHFNLSTNNHIEHQIFHLGLRQFPQRQLTLECVEHSKVPLEVDQYALASTPCFEVPVVESVTVRKDGELKELSLEGKSICLLHGQGICAHTKSTPGFWRFLHSIRKELRERFDEVIFVGSDRDREVGVSAYPYFSSYDDQGGFLELARLMNRASLVVGVGSSVIVLAGALKVPGIRVHDPIGDHPRTIWDNLGSNQLNRTEVDLRTDWAEFRDKWLGVPVV